MDRCHVARETELAQMWAHRRNRLAIAAIWYILPTAVIVTSFACYTLIAGHALDVPTAFTAMTLFALLSTPLTALPSCVASDIVVRAMLIESQSHNSPASSARLAPPRRPVPRRRARGRELGLLADPLDAV